MTKKSRPRAKGKARSGTWSLLQNKLFTLFIVLLPVQLGLHFWPDWALVSGIRVDYLAPVIYLTDLIVIALLAVVFAALWNFWSPQCTGGISGGELNLSLLFQEKYYTKNSNCIRNYNATLDLLAKCLDKLNIGNNTF